jgi:hypothetical protein
VLRKYGMVINPNPPLGAVVGSLAALALSPLYRYRTNIFKINKYFFLVWSFNFFRTLTCLRVICDGSSSSSSSVNKHLPPLYPMFWLSNS